MSREQNEYDLKFSESYKKAKDAILNRQKEDAYKIKAGVNLQNVKPQIDKKSTEQK